MSGQGAPHIEVDVEDISVAIVASSWHDEIMNGLIAGAEKVCKEVGVDYEVFRVPGSFELPLAAQALAESDFDVVVALGVVIRGGTPHFEYVSSATTEGLMRVMLDTGVPVGFGLLTCDDEKQARDRAGLPGSSEDKGAEATYAALSMASLLGDIEE
jgi:6,7-dimethyl-8-ribityllumazine synthase